MGSQSNSACPVATMTRILGSRWTMQIIHHLRQRHRYCELRILVGNVNPTTFTQRLKFLEEQDLIARHTFPDNSRHVDYELTAAGRELLSILDALAAEEATASALCPIVSEATITSIMLARDHGRHQDI